MSGLTKDDLHSGRVRGEATDVLSGRTEQLRLRPGSACQFFEPFACGRYCVQLRLDWNDLDANGNPMLDADFYDAESGVMDKSMRQHEAHHTPSIDEQSRTYSWEFADESRHLLVTLIWVLAVEATARAVAGASVTITRAGEKPPQQ